MREILYMENVPLDFTFYPAGKPRIEIGDSLKFLERRQIIGRGEGVPDGFGNIVTDEREDYLNKIKDIAHKLGKFNKDESNIVVEELEYETTIGDVIREEGIFRKKVYEVVGVGIVDFHELISKRGMR